LELRTAIFGRRSIRAYKRREVERGRIMKVIRDANQAPSAGNLQARDFVVVMESARKKALAEAALGQDFIAEAPVVLVVCANRRRSASKYGRRGAELYCILDAALAAQNLMLSCTEEGLGTCYVGAFDERRVRSLLELPGHVLPIGIIPVGYPDEEPYLTDRLPVEEITHWERWRGDKGHLRRFLGL